MTQQTRPSFELLLGEVSLKAPETPLYLQLASQVLEARRAELEDGLSPDSAPTPPAPPSPPPAAVATLEPPVESAAAEETVVEPPPQPVETAPAPALEVAAEAVEVTTAVEEAPEPEAAPVETAVPEQLAAPAFSSPEPAPAAPVVQTALSVPAASAAPAAEAPARRARWFRGQLPVVNFEDGSSRVMDSLDALKDLLRSRGLTPHPRGDASMLLWQVRNRLGLSVDQVDA